MPGFHLLSALLAFAAFASYVNRRYLRLPASIGLMAIALALSVTLAVLEHAGLIRLDALSDALGRVDFGNLLLHGMLAFLLFAGALHIDWNELRKHAGPIATLATVGVVLTCMVAGTLVWALAALLGIELPYIYALVFGALIAPTDPIAVLAIMRKARVPQSIEVRITGESLFNDGMGVVLFLTMLQFAEAPGGVSAVEVAVMLAKAVAGGLALGALLGWATYRLLRTVDEYAVEGMLTVALAAGVYSLAEILEVSAPIAVVVAGLFTGNRARAYAMSRTTRENLDTFWALIDELLNALLFVLMGLEVLMLDIPQGRWQVAALAAGSIVAVLFGRLVGVALPAPLLGIHAAGSRIAVFTWAGLRGGISIALALSLAASPHRDALLLMAYVVVVFSVLVQGLTLRSLLVRLCPRLTQAEKRLNEG